MKKKDEDSIQGPSKKMPPLPDENDPTVLASPNFDRLELENSALHVQELVDEIEIEETIDDFSFGEIQVNSNANELDRTAENEIKFESPFSQSESEIDSLDGEKEILGVEVKYKGKEVNKVSEEEPREDEREGKVEENEEEDEFYEEFSPEIKLNKKNSYLKKFSFPNFLFKFKKRSFNKDEILSTLEIYNQKVSKLWRKYTANKNGAPFNLFAPEHRPTIHTLFIFIFSFISCYVIGKLLAFLFVSFLFPEVPVPSLPMNVVVDFSQKHDTIRTSNLFKTPENSSQEGAEGKEKAPIIDESVICSAAEQNSALPIDLLNSIVMQDSKKSVITAQIKGQTDILSLREGEKINGMAKIDKIERFRIIFKNLQSGQCEFVQNKDYKEPTNFMGKILSPKEGKKLMDNGRKKGEITNQGNNYVISKKAMHQKLENINEILTQARGVQIPNPDGSISFKIVDILPNSIFSSLGIEENDRITQINGKKITGLNEIMNLFGKIRNVENINISIMKDDGSESTLNYKFSQ